MSYLIYISTELDSIESTINPGYCAKLTLEIEYDENAWELYGLWNEETGDEIDMSKLDTSDIDKLKRIAELYWEDSRWGHINDSNDGVDKAYEDWLDRQRE